MLRPQQPFGPAIPIADQCRQAVPTVPQERSNRSTKPALVPSGVEICRYHYVARIADQEYDRPVGEKRRIMATMADQDTWHGRPPLKLESRDAPYGITIKIGQNRSAERRVGKSVSGRVDFGGRRIIKKKTIIHK